VLEEDAETLALERAGLDNGSWFIQAGMGSGELGDIDHRTRPEAIELLEELTLQETEQARLGTDEADFLANEQLGAGRKKGGLAQATGHEVEHRSQVAGVVLAVAEVGLQAGELDLVGVEKDIVHPGCGLHIKMNGIAFHKGTCPGLVIDAGGLVTEEDKVKVRGANQGVGEGKEAAKAGVGGRELEGADEFLPGGGECGGPMDVLAHIQEQDQDAIIADLGQALAKGGHAIDVATFQVM
jgi:hypothetical protein